MALSHISERVNRINNAFILELLMPLPREKKGRREEEKSHLLGKTRSINGVLLSLLLPALWDKGERTTTSLPGYMRCLVSHLKAVLSVTRSLFHREKESQVVCVFFGVRSLAGVGGVHENNFAALVCRGLRFGRFSSLSSVWESVCVCIAHSVRPPAHYAKVV